MLSLLHIMCKHVSTLILLWLQVNILVKSEPSSCESRTCLPSSCADIRTSGNTRSGIYTVYPKQWFDKSNISVYCDMETDGGGWTVFQRRDKYEEQQSFIQNWNSYRKGFGSLHRDFWLGNDNIHVLTNQEYVSLRIDMEDFEGIKNFVVYNRFRIEGCQDRYRLKLEQFSGTTGDSLAEHNNKTFVTFDDGDIHNCSQMYKGGWWYNNCHLANLNGLYVEGSSEGYAIRWYYYNLKSLKKTEMKIRPLYFSLPTRN